MDVPESLTQTHYRRLPGVTWKGTSGCLIAGEIVTENSLLRREGQRLPLVQRCLPQGAALKMPG